MASPRRRNSSCPHQPEKSLTQTVGGLLDPESYSRYNGTDVEVTLPRRRGRATLRGVTRGNPSWVKGRRGVRAQGLSVESTGEAGVRPGRLV